MPRRILSQSQTWFETMKNPEVRPRRQRLSNFSAAKELSKNQPRKEKGNFGVPSEPKLRPFESLLPTSPRLRWETKRRDNSNVSNFKLLPEAPSFFKTCKECHLVVCTEKPSGSNNNNNGSRAEILTATGTASLRPLSLQRWRNELRTTVLFTVGLIPPQPGSHPIVPHLARLTTPRRVQITHPAIPDMVLNSQVILKFQVIKWSQNSTRYAHALISLGISTKECYSLAKEKCFHLPSK